MVTQIEALSDRLDLLVPDLPGFGASPGPFSLERAMQQLEPVIQGHDDVSVCGLSLGAMVALHLAAGSQRSAVKALILSGVQLRPPRLLLRVQEQVMKLVPASRYSAEDSSVTKPAVLAAMRALVSVDLRPDLGRVRARTLVLCGSKDRLNLGAARAAAAGIPGGELRVIEGAGHVWNREQPAMFNDTVIRWLNA